MQDLVCQSRRCSNRRLAIGEISFFCRLQTHPEKLAPKRTTDEWQSLAGYSWQDGIGFGKLEILLKWIETVIKEIFRLLIVILASLGTAVVITSCRGEKKSLIPPQELAFCKIVNDYRELYKEESDKDEYIGQEESLEKIYRERTEQLVGVLGKGELKGWVGTLRKITSIPGKQAGITVDLPCHASLSSQADLTIKMGTPVYESLKRCHEKSSISFSGNLLIIPSISLGKYPYKIYYGENSSTKEESIAKLELLFKYREIKDMSMAIY